MIIKYKTEKNQRDYNEDRIIKFKNKYLEGYGISDGHGKHHISNYLKNELKNYFNIPFKNLDKKKIIEIFGKINNDIHQKFPKISFQAGSTCCIILIYNLDSFFINLGDSKGIIIRNNKIIYQTKEHKPNLEKDKLKEIGGNVYNDEGVWRIDDLAVSRAFGDLDNIYINCIPDIKKIKLKNSDEILIASDGLWDVIKPEKLLLTNYRDLDNLIKQSIKKKSEDNISIIYVNLT